jgi:hypothetical protein
VGRRGRRKTRRRWPVGSSWMPSGGCQSRNISTSSPPSIAEPPLPPRKVGDDDAFIVTNPGKVGGPDEKSPAQSRAIERQQVAEFCKQYGGNESDETSDPGEEAAPDDDSQVTIVVEGGSAPSWCCAWMDGDCASAARGIKVDNVKKMDGYDGWIIGVTAMSNLAVGRARSTSGTRGRPGPSCGGRCTVRVGVRHLSPVCRGS